MYKDNVKISVFKLKALFNVYVAGIIFFFFLHFLLIVFRAACLLLKVFFFFFLIYIKLDKLTSIKKKPWPVGNGVPNFRGITSVEMEHNCLKHDVCPHSLRIVCDILVSVFTVQKGTLSK